MILLAMGSHDSMLKCSVVWGVTTSLLHEGKTPISQSKYLNSPRGPMAQRNTEKYPQILREISTKYWGIKAFHLRFLMDVSRLHAKEHLPSSVSVSSDPFITLLWRGYELNSTSVTITATSHWDLLNNWEEYYGSPFWNCFIGRRKWMTMLWGSRIMLRTK